MIDLLYLCDKSYYDTKMSRVRFHGMTAIGQLINVTWSGNEWDNYDSDLTVQQNISSIYKNKKDPDIVVAFKPLKLKKFADIRAIKCLRYNEMFDTEWTKKEIIESGADLVICHHKNDMIRYKEIFKEYDKKNIHFDYVAHCAEKTIYKDYKTPKECDVLLAGAVYTQSILGNHYPLRIRFVESILPKLSKRYKCCVLRHPGGNLLDATTDRNSREYARALNSAKICLTCSGAPRSRFGKYTEIPMCASALVADLPDEEHDFFKQFMIVVDMSMTDDEIVEKISYYLENDQEREKLIQKGLELNKEYTQEKYAERFLNSVEKYMELYSK